jgi:hypothetical protein
MPVQSSRFQGNELREVSLARSRPKKERSANGGWEGATALGLRTATRDIERRSAARRLTPPIGPNCHESVRRPGLQASISNGRKQPRVAFDETDDGPQGSGPWHPVEMHSLLVSAHAIGGDLRHVAMSRTGGPKRDHHLLGQA